MVAMKTVEHREAGDKIGIKSLGNQYLVVDKRLIPSAPPVITLMRKVNGIPVPITSLKLTAGEIVALAGDYYTKAGWGFALQTTNTINSEEASKELLKIEIAPRESLAFKEAFDDMASPKTTRKAIDRIFSWEKTSWIPDSLKQLIYSLTVPNYFSKLSNNEAHFAPWSLRAYLVGHHTALQTAAIAYQFKQLEEETLIDLPQEIVGILEQIEKNPQAYGFDQFPGYDSKVLYIALKERYHALAVAQDLFALHFYSDHFAGGHMSRMGILRQRLPEQFGFLGGILVNNMHNEDNTNGVASVNLYRRKQETETFQMLKEQDQAYGDGTYDEQDNNKNADMLVNGMDSSLGDIASMMKTGKMPDQVNYGGLSFMNDINYHKPQLQPMFIYTDKGPFFRKNIAAIDTLSPSDYKATVDNPEQHGYQKLTSFQALVLVTKLRLLSFFYTPTIKPLSKQKLAKINAEKEAFDLAHQPKPPAQEAGIVEHPELGAWRKNPAAASAGLRASLFSAVDDHQTESEPTSLMVSVEA